MKGHIRKRGKRSWSIVIDLSKTADGQRRQKWITVHGTRKQAEQAKRRLQQSIVTGMPLDPRTATVSQLLDYWLEYEARPHIAARTYQRYKEICQLHWKPALGNTLLEDLQGWMVSDYYRRAAINGKRRSPGGLAAATLRHHHAVLHQALARAIQWRLLTSNPLDDIRLPVDKSYTKTSRALDILESQRLLTHLYGESHALYMATLLALTTGMRRGELLALRWRDFDFDKYKLNVHAALEFVGQEIRRSSPKTAGSRRSILLPQRTCQALRLWHVKQAPENGNTPILPDGDGGFWHPARFSYAWRKSIAPLEIPQLRFHDLRHSHASQLLGSGVNPQIVAQRLGHASTRTTMDIYAHILPDMQAVAAEQLDRIYDD